MTNHTDASTAQTSRPRGGSIPSGAAKPSGGLEFWVAANGDALARQWAERIKARGGAEPPWDRTVESFTRTVVSMLGPMLGPRRADAETLWVRAAELFGAAAAERGLAAGEIIEELQILRDLLIRALYREGSAARQALPLRQVLFLNRALDHLVAHGSVGHTDALFFQLLERHGVASPEPPEVRAGEVARQLSQIRTELEDVLAER